MINTGIGRIYKLQFEMLSFLKKCFFLPLTSAGFADVVISGVVASPSPDDLSPDPSSPSSSSLSSGKLKN